MSFEFDIRKDEPLVSALIVTYNHAPYIRECLEGIIAQKTDFPFELIVHDDASTDGTAEIVREYAEKYPHIIVPILQIENQWSKHGSVGFDIYPLVRGKYVALCDGDDYWSDPLKLQKQADALETHLECSFCGHNTLVLIPGKESRPFSASKRRETCSIYRFPKRLNKRTLLRVHTSSRMFRMTALDLKNLKFKSNVTLDVSLYWYLLSKGDLFYIDEVMSVYNGTGTGFCSGSSTQRNHLMAALNIMNIDEELDFKYHRCIFARQLRKYCKSLGVPLWKRLWFRMFPHAIALKDYPLLRSRIEEMLCLTSIS